MKKSKIQKANEQIVRKHDRLARGILGNALSSPEKRTIARAMRKVAKRSSQSAKPIQDDVDWYGVEQGEEGELKCVSSARNAREALDRAKRCGGHAFVQFKDGTRRYL